MLVIQTANGNTYPAETCVWRTAIIQVFLNSLTGSIEYATSALAAAADANGAVTPINKGYKLTHLDINTPNVATSGTPTAAPAGAQLGYIGKSGRFVAYTEPA